jgi:tRNA A-37 threonylcarbamoyl transferase component Bud32
MIGRTIAQYRIVEPLGRGAMGIVYKAIDETLDREVAIKVLNPALADGQTITRFRAEATALARLNHPAIATVYELFRHDDDLLMVMEFVRGETLEQLCNRLGALPLDDAEYLIDQVLAALEHAHRAGIVHCDIKPANIMVTLGGGIKVMDFGTARVREAEHAAGSGHVMGTPAYMAPEQVLGHRLDGRADLYAVGVVFYRLLTGALPFDADTTVAMVQKQIADAPAALRVYREGLPSRCEEIVRRALAKASAERFQTAEEFRHALHTRTGIVVTEATTALSVAGAEPDAAAAMVRESRESRTTTVLPGHRGPFGRWMPAVSAAGALAVVGFVAWSHVALAPTLTSDDVAVARRVVNVTPPPEPAMLPAQTPPPRPAHAPAAPPPAKPSTAKLAPPVKLEPPDPTVSDPAPAVSKAPAPVPAPPVSIKPAGTAFPRPFVFEARALVVDGDHQRERECQVVLADGRISIHALDGDDMLRVVPYDHVMAIGYSRGRDPLWKTPAGPMRIGRAGGGVLRLFRGDRYWLSIRTPNADEPFVVLRLENDVDARRAMTAIEQRTGRRTQVIADGEGERSAAESF